MDWNRDGKVDAHDATLYHTVINNNRKPESSGLNYGSKRSYSSTNKSHHNQTPAHSFDSGSVCWIIAVIVIAL